MAGIFPNGSVGGVLVRDPDTGLPIEQPNTSGVLVPPAEYPIDCDMNALPDDCKVRPENRQINAIVSELVNFAAYLNPLGPWECAEYDNLAASFAAWVETFTSGEIGTQLCAVAEGDGSEATSSLIYCADGITKKLPIEGPGGLLELISEFVCAGTVGAPSTNDDYFLYCRNGVIRKTQANTYQLFTGEWTQARAYGVNNLVRKGGLLYSPNAAIPSGTAFVIGTAGATWYEVSPSAGSEPYDPDQGYTQDTLISKDGTFYAANADIPADTPFVIGTTGMTWREVDITQSTIVPHNVNKAYPQYSIVSNGGLIYRATGGPLGPAPFAKGGTNWLLVGGERNVYMGVWSQINVATDFRADLPMQYLAGQVVSKGTSIYRANSDIPLNAAFTIGTNGATWMELSPSAAPEYDEATAYSQDTVISYNGKYYAANEDIPAGTPFVIGTSGETWREVQVGGGGSLILPNHTNTKSYAMREIVAYPDEYSVSSGTGIWRAKVGIPSGQNLNRTEWDLIADRSQYRGRWQASKPYKQDDVVYVSIINFVGGDDASAERFELFRAVAAIPATETTSPLSDIKWKPLSSDRGPYQPSFVRYYAGDIVTTETGQYMANGGILPGAAFVVGTSGGTWQPLDNVRVLPVIASLASNALETHWNAYLQFTGAGAKTYTIPPNSGAFELPIGATLAGVSVSGQLTIVAGAGVTIRSPDSLSLRDVDYAAFTLTKVAINTWHLSGDLA